MVETRFATYPIVLLMLGLDQSSISPDFSFQDTWPILDKRETSIATRCVGTTISKQSLVSPGSKETTLRLLLSLLLQLIIIINALYKLNYFDYNKAMADVEKG